MLNYCLMFASISCQTLTHTCHPLRSQAVILSYVGLGGKWCHNSVLNVAKLKSQWGIKSCSFSSQICTWHRNAHFVHAPNISCLSDSNSLSYGGLRYKNWDSWCLLSHTQTFMHDNSSSDSAVPCQYKCCTTRTLLHLTGTRQKLRSLKTHDAFSPTHKHSCMI